MTELCSRTLSLQALVVIVREKEQRMRVSSVAPLVLARPVYSPPARPRSFCAPLLHAARSASTCSGSAPLSGLARLNSARPDRPRLPPIASMRLRPVSAPTRPPPLALLAVDRPRLSPARCLRASPCLPQLALPGGNRSPSSPATPLNDLRSALDAGQQSTRASSH